MKSQRFISRVRKHSAVALVSSCAVFQLGACIPQEFTAVQTTTVTLDGRTVITNLVNAAIITPLQTAIADYINAYFDRVFEE